MTPASGSFFLTPEQSAVFADPDSPAAMVGGFYAVSAVYHDEPLVAESFRTGRGLPWGGHHSCLFLGSARFFRPGYQANINENWIPALDGVQQKLGRELASQTSDAVMASPPHHGQSVRFSGSGPRICNCVRCLARHGRLCTPGSLSQEVGLALGAQAGEGRLRDVLSKGGFTRVRRAAETPFNMILGSAAIGDLSGVDV